ncbi:MAG: esterase/lipase family protein [Cyanophyceae cyanobacterium]
MKKTARLLGDRRCTDEEQQDRHPVLLIHGLNDTNAVFTPMAQYLRQRGWSVYSLDLIPSNGSFQIEQLATQVADYIKATFSAAQPLDLIGFSMGGIITRYYLQRLGGVERVKRYISISAPNNGTLTAYALPLPGIVQMRPNSLLLQDLNRDGAEILGRVNATVMWTPYDLMIVPSFSSRLAVGHEVVLPIPFHSWMLSDTRALSIIAASLSEPLKHDLQPPPAPDRQKLLQNDDKT